MSASKWSNFLRTLACASAAAALPLTATGKDCSPPACNADESISKQVLAAFETHPALLAPNSIRVQTHDRVVYLYGHVSTELQGEQAVSLAVRVKDVRRVIASLRPESTGG